MNSGTGSLPVSRSARTTQSGSKHGFDFQGVNLNSLESLKKSQLLSPQRQREAVVLSDAMPFHHHDGIPRILLILVNAFVDCEAYKERGIFRLAADNDERLSVRNELGVVGMEVWNELKGNYRCIEGSSAYLLAEEIKEFIRSLSPCLFPSSLYDLVAQIGHQGSLADLDEVWKVVDSVPSPNYSVLMYLLTLLYKVSLVTSNNMSITNLCICFGPNLIRPEYL